MRGIMYAPLFGFIVMLGPFHPAHAQPPAAPAAEWTVAEWTVAECEQALRDLMSLPADYHLTFEGKHNYTFFDTYPLWHFKGEKRANGTADRFEVDAKEHLVLRACMFTRLDDRFNTVDDPLFWKTIADRDKAERLAQAIIEKHCPESIKKSYRYTKSTKLSPYAFTWQEIVQPWGLRLPRKVIVEIDGISGEFCWWDLELREIVIPTKPRMTRDEVVSVVIHEGGRTVTEQTEIYPVVIGGPPGFRAQRIVWHVEWRRDDQMVGVVVIDDASGKIGLAM